MSTRKCSACGHTMGVTHAQYTQCPANVAKKVPTNAKVPMLTATTVGHVVETKESPVSSAFSLFNKKSDDTLTAEGAVAIVNLTDQLPIKQQEQILEDAYSQLDDKEKANFAGFMALKCEDDIVADNFVIKLAKDPDTPREVIEELRKWPRQDNYYDYPEHVHLSRLRGKLGWWRTWNMTRKGRLESKQFIAVAATGGAVGAGAGFIVLGPVGGVLGGLFGTAFGSSITATVKAFSNKLRG